MRITSADVFFFAGLVNGPYRSFYWDINDFTVFSTRGFFFVLSHLVRRVVEIESNISRVKMARFRVNCARDSV